MKKKVVKYNFEIILGFLLIIFGLTAVSLNYFEQKKDNAFSTMRIALYESEIPMEYEDEDEIPESVETSEILETQTEVPNTTSEEPPKPKPKPVDYSKYYVGTLEIPKINLKKGFLDINSPYNNVNKNITVIQTSTYPDVEKGNFILAGHNGNISVSYFNQLYKLVLDDIAYINYKNKKYTYKLVDIYTQPKIGQIAIYRDNEETTLTLVTCTRGDKTTQTIYILELINVE